MNDKVRRSIRGSKNHEKCSKHVQTVVQNHETCGLGVEKNEVEKKRGFFSEKSHAGVRGCLRVSAEIGRLGPIQVPPGSLCETLVTPYDHSTACLEGTVAEMKDEI